MRQRGVYKYYHTTYIILYHQLKCIKDIHKLFDQGGPTLEIANIIKQRGR